VATVATEIGMEFVGDDPYGLGSREYWLFGYGRGVVRNRHPLPKVSNLAVGFDAAGRRVSVFDLRLFRQSDVYLARSAVIIDVDGKWPHLTVVPSALIEPNLSTWVEPRIAQHRALVFDVPELGHGLHIRAEDHTSAESVLHGPIVEDLKSEAFAEVAIELYRGLLCVTPQREPAELPQLVDAAVQLANHLPDV